MEIIVLVSGAHLFALTVQLGPECCATWIDANRSRGQKQHPSFGRPQNGRTAYLRSPQGNSADTVQSPSFKKQNVPIRSPRFWQTGAPARRN